MPPRTAVHSLQTPLGWVRMRFEGSALCALSFCEAPRSLPDAPCPAAAEAAEQLRQYFAGQRTAFTIPLAPQGTPFQLRVWAALCTIPWGTTLPYGQVAAKIGAPRAARAVGAACHANPIAILIPCHRVIGKNRAPVGYAWGLDRKLALLQLENPKT